MPSGWDLSSGELKDNQKIDLFEVIAKSLFHGVHNTTYKYCFFKSLLDNLFRVDENYSLPLKTIGETFATTYWNMIKFPLRTNFTNLKKREATEVFLFSCF